MPSSWEWHLVLQITKENNAEVQKMAQIFPQKIRTKILRRSEHKPTPGTWYPLRCSWTWTLSCPSLDPTEFGLNDLGLSDKELLLEVCDQEDEEQEEVEVNAEERRKEEETLDSILRWSSWDRFCFSFIGFSFTEFEVSTVSAVVAVSDRNELCSIFLLLIFLACQRQRTNYQIHKWERDYKNLIV